MKYHLNAYATFMALHSGGPGIPTLRAGVHRMIGRKFAEPFTIPQVQDFLSTLPSEYMGSATPRSFVNEMIKIGQFVPEGN